MLRKENKELKERNTHLEDEMKIVDWYCKVTEIGEDNTSLKRGYN